MTTGIIGTMNTKIAMTRKTSGQFGATHLPATLITAFLLIALCTSNALAQQSTLPADQLPAPAGMALIPAGPFLMGNNNDFYDNDFDERPQHMVDLPPFFIDRYPVTNQDYKAFADATGHQPPQYWGDSGNIPDGKAQHPVTGVTYIDALTFAAWKGRRLPTEQEWEKSSRGTEGLRWPWGNVFDKNKANVGLRRTTPVGAYPEGCNAYSLCDMAGNVWEWTGTWYAPYPDAPPNRAILRFLNDKYLSVRGGSSGSDIGSARGADRGIKKPMEFGPALGFRTVLDIPGYESYRDAVQTIALARETIRTTAIDITRYEEHAESRELMEQATTDLANAGEEFRKRRFADSGITAQHSIRKAGKAHQLALTVTQDYQEKREIQTAEVLGRLEMKLKMKSQKLDSKQQALIAHAEDQLRLGRQMEAEGGWGYAQMHGYIGLSMLGKL